MYDVLETVFLAVRTSDWESGLLISILTSAINSLSDSGQVTFQTCKNKLRGKGLGISPASPYKGITD